MKGGKLPIGGGFSWQIIDSKIRHFNGAWENQAEDVYLLLDILSYFTFPFPTLIT